MKKECQGCAAFYLGYCPGDYCKKFSEDKMIKPEEDYLEFEAVQANTLREKLISLVRK